ncbi:hypothetical protein [Pyxidicoccus xibeiensis]|uniref:hypothetical protein n=1 Tax=Pyxidicoccus xibeiensis TaxID=2906759 RepID=UPI0020A75DAB|nr:hypothetical protein [Pyxidicoccus xibeiensis]MCP3144500.1 hypothetical protein [Pyxidicoccus xibeiensis]
MSARERLARAQEALALALGTGAPVPPGFDVERVRAAARALVDKRRRWVERAWPVLTVALGADFVPRFESWAERHPMTVEPNALADGRRFAETLRAAGPLPDPLLVALQDFDLRWRLTEDGEVLPRRGPRLSLRRLGTSGRFRLAVKPFRARVYVW